MSDRRRVETTDGAMLVGVHESGAIQLWTVHEDSGRTNTLVSNLLRHQARDLARALQDAADQSSEASCGLSFHVDAPTKEHHAPSPEWHRYFPPGRKFEPTVPPGDYYTDIDGVLHRWNGSGWVDA